MLTYLGLKNFRAFESVELELRPITVLVGPNNSGKSSILSGLRILSQTVASEDFRVPLLLKGPLGDFGTYKDLVFENDKQKNIGVSLGMTLAKRAVSKEARLHLTFAYRPQRREIILRDSTLFDEAQRKIYAIKSSSDPDKHQIEFYPLKGETVTQGFGTYRTRIMHFVAPAWSFVSGRMNNENWVRENRGSLAIVDAVFEQVLHLLRSLEYIGPFRAEPQRTNLFSGERPTTVGVDGAKAIDMLASDYLRRGRRKKQLLNQAVRWLKKAEIARDFKVRVLSDRHYEMLVQHPVTQEFENLADVGYGTSQVLPVIAAGYNLQTESALVVEQPELHLHPGAQSELGDFFLDLYRSGVQSILETHSEHIILRLQRHVAEGSINPRDLHVYFVHASGGRKIAHKLTVGEDGIFKEPWPRGFFEERLKEVTALARAPLVGTGTSG